MPQQTLRDGLWRVVAGLAQLTLGCREVEHHSYPQAWL
jgi:hypothetical protein